MSEENVYIGGTSIQIGQHGFINQPKEIIEYIKYLHKEIERLNKELKQEKKDFKETNDKCFKLISENKRLNNIINELEEELERESNIKEENTCLEHNTFIDIRNTLKIVLKRLQELKGQ